MTMVTTIRVRDLTSGEEIEVDGAAECIATNAVEADASGGGVYDDEIPTDDVYTLATAAANGTRRVYLRDVGNTDDEERGDIWWETEILG